MDLKSKLLLGTATIALSIGASVMARADDTTEAILKRLDSLEKENSKLKSELKRIENKPTAKATVAKQAQGQRATSAASAFIEPPGTMVEVNYVPTDAYAGPASAEEQWFFRKKPGAKGLTFLTPGGEITMYGQLDVSIDDTTKGIADKVGPNGPTDRPIGNVGWMPAMSTNLSYVGVRGAQKVDDEWRFIYQLETQIDVTATSGTIESNSNQSNVVKGALTSRNSFIGFASPIWGSFMAGKTDAPYKNSTAMMNPFSGMLGDYQVVMGNTGGDNRVEFGTRLDHSVWWQSPDWSGF